MFVLPKRNILLPGDPPVVLKRGIVATVPEWAANTPYFKALVADGKVVVTTTKDKDTQAAAEKKVRTRRGKEVTEEE